MLSATSLSVACSSDDAAGGLPGLSGTPSSAPTTPVPTTATPTSSAPTTPSATSTGLFGDQGSNQIARGKVTVTGPDQTAAAAAWLRYWQVRAQSFFAAKVDPTALGEVSSGQATEAVIEYVGQLQRRKRHTVGGSTLDVKSVRVSGVTATVTGCLRDRSADVDDKTKRPVELPSGPISARGTLTRSGPEWVVTTVKAGGACT